MAHWCLNDIPWHKFDAIKARPDLIAIVKAAAMVEHNGYDYARYLCEVFDGDPEFQQAAKLWAVEEVQHGQALRKWSELADPAFDFDKSFTTFTTGYKLPINVTQSVRGSRAGELIARCVVETGTSSYYTAIKDSTDEPVLKAICAKIAADEFRHYKLFYTHLKRYLEKENIGTWRRFRIALTRVTESEDDELAYAFYAAHHAGSDVAYDHEQSCKQHMAYAYNLYRRPHIERMTAMIFKAVGITPYRFLTRILDSVAWNIMQLRIKRLSSYRQAILS